MRLLLLFLLSFLPVLAYSQFEDANLQPQYPLLCEGESIEFSVDLPDIPGATEIYVEWQVWYFADLNPDWLGVITPVSDSTAVFTLNSLPCNYWPSSNYCWLSIEALIYVNDVLWGQSGTSIGNEVPHTVESIVLCEGEDYLGYTESGIYTNHYSIDATCDSVVTTILVVESCNRPFYTDRYKTTSSVRSLLRKAKRGFNKDYLLQYEDTEVFLRNY
jgi:hypothetical protein